MFAGYFRDKIARGELAAGSRFLSEAQLMEQFGVSRPTVREALLLLASEQVVVVRRGACGGAHVTTPTPTPAGAAVAMLFRANGLAAYDALALSALVTTRAVERSLAGPAARVMEQVLLEAARVLTTESWGPRARP